MVGSLYSLVIKLARFGIPDLPAAVQVALISKT